MSVSYTCPNPDCGVTLKTPARVQVGKSVKCPKCQKPFVPEPGAKEEPAPAPKPADTLKLADEKPTAAPAKQAHPDDDEDAESVKKGYGVIEETEEEKKEAKKNKPKFTEVQDKFKKSARGPAQSLLVMPANLLTAEGLITCAGGLLVFVALGMWALVFNDAPPGEEEVEECIQYMMLGLCAMCWGGMICYGASHMQELGDYAWAMTGSIMGIVPLLVGVFGIIMLTNPKVKAGFEEGSAGPEDGEDEDEEEKEDEDEDEDDEDEDDDDEDDDDDEEDSAAAKKPKKKKKKTGEEESTGKKLAKKAAKKLGRKLLGSVFGGSDDEDGGDDEPDTEEKDEVEDEVKDEIEESGEDEEDEDHEGRAAKAKKRKKK